MREDAAPRLLVTGFGPFPGAPDNPTEALVRDLGGMPPEAFGAAALRARVLPTDYRRSWAMLNRIYAGFPADVVVHFGLSRRAEGLLLERFAHRRVAADRPDAAGYAPRAGVVRRSGPDRLEATLPMPAILRALEAEGFPAMLSDDAGPYVCNATLYRSLLRGSGPVGAMIGFVHIPPGNSHGFDAKRLAEAATIILRSAAAVWREAKAG